MKDTIDLQELATKRRSAEESVTRLEADLETARGQLRDLDAVVEGLQRLGFLRTDDAQPVLEKKIVPRVGRRPAKRIRSTQLAAEIVTASAEPLDRTQVLKALERTHGIPPAWENPRNAIGNALNRAVSQGLIETYGADHFARVGFADGQES